MGRDTWYQSCEGGLLLSINMVGGKSKVAVKEHQKVQTVAGLLGGVVRRGCVDLVGKVYQGSGDCGK